MQHICAVCRPVTSAGCIVLGAPAERRYLAYEAALINTEHHLHQIEQALRHMPCQVVAPEPWAAQRV